MRATFHSITLFLIVRYKTLQINITLIPFLLRIRIFFFLLSVYKNNVIIEKYFYMNI